MESQIVIFILILTTFIATNINAKLIENVNF